jgi:four helix bundle protein
MKRTTVQDPASQRPKNNPERRASGAEEDTVWAFREDEKGNGRRFDLEERLLAFASAIIDLSEKLPSSRAGNHVAGQILRSGLSPFPNHGEAEEAESKDDFIHKLKICLKELRETRRWAGLIQKQGWATDQPVLTFVLRESDELIRIFFSSIQTARRNALTASRRPPDASTCREVG